MYDKHEIAELVRNHMKDYENYKRLFEEYEKATGSEYSSSYLEIDSVHTRILKRIRKLKKRINFVLDLDEVDSLTNKELAVLMMTSDGLTLNESGQIFNLTPQAVSKIFNRACQKVADYYQENS